MVGGDWEAGLIVARGPHAADGLAERLEDIPLLVQHFLRKYNDAYGKNIAGLTRRAQALMLQHGWPGNVRELENVISSASITAIGTSLTLRICRSNYKGAVRGWSIATTGGRCPSKRFAGSTSSGSSACAKGTACALRKSWDWAHKFVPLLEAGWPRGRCEGVVRHQRTLSIGAHTVGRTRSVMAAGRLREMDFSKPEPESSAQSGNVPGARLQK